MTPERWQEIKRIFDDALKRSPDERRSYLAAACGGDEDLRCEVESLLESFNGAAGFMEQPAVAEVAEQINASQVKKFSEGQTVAHYRIISELGSGGQGAVYKALDTKLGRAVALKLLPPELTAVDDTSRKRFRREAQLASSLDHPNICTIHDLTEVDGATFIVMQFVAGRNIRQFVRGRPLEIRAALRIAIQVCDALSAAHAKGIIHRDIKAHNVIISENGQAKVLDFGLAKLIREGNEAGDQTELTATGSPYGTPTSAAPEQARGEKVDHRADIFSTGVLLYEMLAGIWPFQGKTAVDVRHAVLHAEPKPVGEARGGAIPAKLEVIVGRALAKEPADRYQLISQMRDELLEVLRDLPESKESSTENFLENFKPTRLRRPSRLNWKVGLAAVAALSVVASILLYGFYSRRRPPALTVKDTILIADFTNTTGDAVFDDTLKQGLAMQLQQSPFLNIFPSARVRETLRQMEHPADERVTVETGREICQRNDLKALIAGSIAALGSHYVITLEAVNARSGETFARQQVEAGSKEEVLKSLSTAAAGIREQLGESLSSIQQSDIPLYQLTTPSLDALKSFALGFDRSNKGEYFQSIPLFKHATELDPNFAYGYSLLAGNYTIVNEPRRAAENADKAFALKEKVSDREKLYITYVYDIYTLGDLDKAIEVLHVYDQSYPHDFRVSGNMSYAYLLEGHFDKAADEARESVRLNPDISSWHVTLGTALTRLSRFAEAKEAFGRALQMGLGDARMHGGLYQVTFVEGDAAAMQQQLESLRGVPEEYIAADLQTGAAAYAGRWRQSKDSARRAIELAVRVDVKEVAARYAAEQGLRAAALGRCDEAKAYDAQSLALERNQVTLERVALGEALCGNGQAQSLLDELAKQHPSDTLANGLWLPVVHAALELARGNATKAVELLDTTRVYEPAAELWTRYLRGQAYLKSNRGSEAAAEFQQVLSHRGESPLSTLCPLAQLGLARATLQTGDTSRAHEAYESFLNIWKDADADLPILQSAQKEYGNLKF
ncbi:MAG: eukaryotic-like serine/threonine-protein kinase [Acidobacteriota bacterium]|jgi:serine/threonine protein kinase/Flp pilus assembly protein TadD|nr:eukaryotic-like serine/threonine-protein kinase [Acidobacteriota bacterium]